MEKVFERPYVFCQISHFLSLIDNMSSTLLKIGLHFHNILISVHLGAEK